MEHKEQNGFSVSRNEKGEMIDKKNEYADDGKLYFAIPKARLLLYCECIVVLHNLDIVTFPFMTHCIEGRFTEKSGGVISASFHSTKTFVHISVCL